MADGLEARVREALDAIEVFLRISGHYITAARINEREAALRGLALLRTAYAVDRAPDALMFEIGGGGCFMDGALAGPQEGKGVD